MFFYVGALFILAVDLSRFVFEDAECYQENVGQWISLVAARIPRARILVVPTHIDECRNQEEIDLKCRNILTFLKDQLREMTNEIEEKSRHVKKTESHCIPSKELAKILERHKEQKRNLPIISLEYKVWKVKEVPFPIVETQITTVFALDYTQFLRHKQQHWTTKSV